jgi:hypothetical protein
MARCWTYEHDWIGGWCRKCFLTAASLGYLPSRRDDEAEEEYRRELDRLLREPTVARED